MFVCTENRARSAMAAILFRELRPDVETSSAGTNPECGGKPLHELARQLLTRNGYSTVHMSRPLSERDLSADLVVCADLSHARAVERAGVPTENVYLLTDFANPAADPNVHDPKDIQDFEEAYTRILDAVTGFAGQVDSPPPRTATERTTIHHLGRAYDAPVGTGDIERELDALALEGRSMVAKLKPDADGELVVPDHIEYELHELIKHRQALQHELEQRDPEPFPDGMEAYRAYLTLGSWLVSPVPSDVGYVRHGRVAVAECRTGGRWHSSHHDAPLAHCACGLYAATEYAGLSAYLARFIRSIAYSKAHWRTDPDLCHNGRRIDYGVAFARVKLRGPIMRAPAKNLELQCVVRASAVEIQELWTVETSHHRAMSLAGRYRCAVHRVDDLRSVAREQMNCRIDPELPFGAAGVLLLTTLHNTTAVLLQQRSFSTDAGGTWSLPGGARERAESASECAVRELQEETLNSITNNHICIEKEIATSPSYTTVVARTSIAHPIEFDKSESLSMKWVPVDEVERLPLHPEFRKAWPELRRQTV
ncbi:arsenate reductase/protein-tyrosine-phosphatase family protein [Nocardia cyriacigeorgica]|uniref:arsenate reductase/protein-tyrosine-phosphatase family protein n=1 Tax=Nocardia cyriacigeorgica TaxID=135487 RepID=UPI0022B2A3D4|nr:NUDIX domain-containing protein [Nocardia cyriacigeorgica]